MARSLRKRKSRATKVAQPPGTLVYVGDAPLASSQMELLHLGTEGLRLVNPSDEQLKNVLHTHSMYWLQVRGVHDTQAIARLGQIFSLHPLVQEDILDTTHRPKAEDYDSYLFVTIKLPRTDPATQARGLEQISLILGSNYVISFQESQNAVFQSLEKRVTSINWRNNGYGAGYLLYAVLDVIIDHYYTFYEALQDEYEDMEMLALESPDTKTLQKILAMKHETIALRKALWPLREVLSQLERHENKLMPKGITLYLRDIADHVLQLIETADSLRDLMSVTMDIYLSSTNNRINEVMKLLAIIATLFMPLTFLTSLYGMNFDFMPELHIWWAYPALLCLMLGLVAGMIIFFRRRKWF